MPDSYIIEVSSQAAGIVVRETSGYRFFAAAEPFFRLDGRLFRHVVDAQRAATRLANEIIAPRRAALTLSPDRQVGGHFPR